MALDLRGVTYRYPGSSRPSILDVSLRVEDGEILGLSGRNGAGKSTLCLVASGLAPGSVGGVLSGVVTIDGRAIGGRPPHELAGLTGIVFADPATQRSGITGTVFEEVALGPVNLGLPRAESAARARWALELVGILELTERHPNRLAGGEGQLLAIASMLAMEPRVLVLDEPVAELDPEGRARVMAAVQRLADAGAAVLVAEHDETFLEGCRRVLTIDQGIIESGTIDRGAQPQGGQLEPAMGVP
jgi:energy-coupling factor transport system ATP-binding protein